MRMTVQRATLAMCLILAAVTARGAQVPECCVCETDCPEAGDRVCFNVDSPSDCQTACEAVGCGEEMGICIPDVACTEVQDCAEIGGVRCGDDLDNDANGLTDCRDPSCQASGACQAPAPAISRSVAGALALVLALGGMSMLRRRLRAT